MSSGSVLATPRTLIVTFIEDHPKAGMLLRLARRRAQEKGAKWRAVFVETPPPLGQLEDEKHERLLRTMTLAEQMGGEVVHIESENIEDGVEKILEQEAGRVSLVIIGSVEAEGRFGRWRNLPWMRMVRIASQYTQVEVLPLTGQHYRSGFMERLSLRTLRPVHVVYALVAVSLSFACAFVLERELPPALFRINDQNIGLLFMIACAFVAGRFGLLPGLVASVISFLAINYYFTLPYYAIKIDNVTDLLNMGLFLSAALLISLFTSQTRDYAEKAAKREISTQALFTLYRVASDAFSREQALERLQKKLERMLGVDVAFCLPGVMNTDQIQPIYPTGLEFSESDKKALQTCWLEMRTTGLASPFNPGTAWRFEPMISQAGEIGVIAVRPRGKMHLDTWFGRLLTAIADQTATVLDHISLERSMEDTRVSEEREKLRSMLLSSVSHDFKTPLAGIIGALSVHRSLGERLPQKKREELIEAAIEEAQRLDSFITNILDMTRLESGNIRFRKEWHSVKAMVRNVSKRLQHRLRQHELVIQADEPDIEVCMDVMMTEQVLQNLLDNACKYTPAGTRIELRFSADKEKGFICEVRDHGQGLPADKIERAFDKYARLHKKDSQVAGTGLGLAISKTVIDAQGGWIRAANHEGGGAVFTFCLPEWRAAEALPDINALQGGGVA